MIREHIIHPSSPLPPEYRQLEYIESTGTQYINTGVIPSNTQTKVTADIQLTTITPNEAKMLFGCNYSGYYTLAVYSNSDVKMNCGVAGNTLDLIVTTATLDRTDVMLEKIGNRYNVEAFGVSKTGSSGSFNMRNYTCHLFARVGSGGVTNKISMKMYHCQMMLNNSIVREYYPALRISDSKPGLYDLVNNQFYTNAGTGEFLYN